MLYTVPLSFQKYIWTMETKSWNCITALKPLLCVQPYFECCKTVKYENYFIKHHFKYSKDRMGWKSEKQRHKRQ